MNEDSEMGIRSPLGDFVPISLCLHSSGDSGYNVEGLHMKNNHKIVSDVLTVKRSIFHLFRPKLTLLVCKPLFSC